MKLEDLLAENIDKWKAMVTELGGQWVGVQQGFQDVEPFVLFVAPHSMSPIGVPVSQMTLDNVKQKMGLSKLKKTNNIISIETMQSLATELRILTERVESHVQWMEETKNV